MKSHSLVTQLLQIEYTEAVSNGANHFVPIIGKYDVAMIIDSAQQIGELQT